MATKSFTYERFLRFKQAYKACTGESFWFEGHQYITGYAKYVIMWLEAQPWGEAKNLHETN